jgi:methionine-rich copper-binding protein CopC
MYLVFRRASALALLIGAVLFLAISPAFAHVELAGSSPTAGTRLDASPAVIRLEFSTASDPAGDGLLLYDQTGELVETAVTFESDTVAIITPLEPLSGGQYLVSWTMKAGDAHPKSGTIGFSIVLRWSSPRSSRPRRRSRL